MTGRPRGVTVWSETQTHHTRQRLMNAWLALRAEGEVEPRAIDVVARAAAAAEADKAAGGEVYGSTSPRGLRYALAEHFKDKQGLAAAATDLHLERQGVLNLGDLEGLIRARFDVLEEVFDFYEMERVRAKVRELTELIDAWLRWQHLPERGGS